MAVDFERKVSLRGIAMGIQCSHLCSVSAFVQFLSWGGVGIYRHPIPHYESLDMQLLVQAIAKVFL